MRLLRFLRHIGHEFVAALASSLPNDWVSTRCRVQLWRWLGMDIEAPAYVYRHVLLLGRVHIGRGSSISNHSCISGGQAGVYIGRQVMIAPGCVLVAFDHGTRLGAGPMIEQPCEEAPITIGDDVWIGANCTITRGVTIGSGAVIGANSVVTQDVPSCAVVAGAPARVVRQRQ